MANITKHQQSITDITYMIEINGDNTFYDFTQIVSLFDYMLVLINILSNALCHLQILLIVEACHFQNK